MYKNNNGTRRLKHKEAGERSDYEGGVANTKDLQKSHKTHLFLTLPKIHI